MIHISLSLFLALSHAAEEAEMSVRTRLFVGSVSIPSNPFWSRKMPGIHRCNSSFDANYVYRVYSSAIRERMYAIPLSNGGRNSNGWKYEHCAIRFDDALIAEIRSIARADAFIRFYVGNRCVRVKLFDVEDNEVYISTEFKIIMDEKMKNFSVERGKNVKIEKGVIISFKFEMEIKDMKGNEIEEVDTKTRYSYIIAIVAFVFNLLFIVFYSFKKQMIATFELSFTELWRLPNSYNMILFFVSLGILVMSVFFSLWIFHIPNEFVDKLLDRVILLMSTISIIISSILSNIVKNPIGMVNWISPFLVVLLTTDFSFQIVNKFFILFGSDRGFPFSRFIIDNVFFILLAFIYCKSIGRAAILLKPPIEIDAKKGQSNLQKKKLPFYLRIFDILFILISVIILNPTCNHLINMLFNDNEMNFNVFASAFLAYMMISGFFSLIRTTTRINKLNTWQEGHIGIHSIISFFVCGIGFYQIFLNYLNLQSLVMAITLFIPYSLSIISTGVFSSYIISFITVIFSYRQPKNN